MEKGSTFKFAGILTALLLFWAGTAFGALKDGGFDDLTGSDWDWTGNYSVTGVAGITDDFNNEYEFNPMSGSMAALSFSSSKIGGKVIKNSVSQEVTLSDTDNYFNFWFNFWTLDEGSYDAFMVEVEGETVLRINAAGNITLQNEDIANVDTITLIGDDEVGTLDYTGWTGLSINTSSLTGDLDPNRPAPTITLSFMAGNTFDSQYASGVFIDQASIEEDPIRVTGAIVVDPSPAAVPVPTSFILLGFGLIGISSLRRRR